MAGTAGVQHGNAACVAGMFRSRLRPAGAAGRVAVGSVQLHNAVCIAFPSQWSLALSGPEMVS